MTDKKQSGSSTKRPDGGQREQGGKVQRDSGHGHEQGNYTPHTGEQQGSPPDPKKK